MGSVSLSVDLELSDSSKKRFARSRLHEMGPVADGYVALPVNAIPNCIGATLVQSSCDTLSSSVLTTVEVECADSLPTWSNAVHECRCCRQGEAPAADYVAPVAVTPAVPAALGVHVIGPPLAIGSSVALNVGRSPLPSVA